MKGFTHFLGGVTVTSFFPAALAAAADGQPGYFVLGGAAALLPDTLDFKFRRFFQRHDLTVAPDALRPDAAAIARTLARAAGLAADGGKPVTVKLESIRRGASVWQSYSVRFDPARRTVEATVGPLVSSSPAPPQTGAARAPAATADTRVEVFCEYLARIDVDIFDGPILAMIPQTDGRVRVEFIPWHRRGTHSLTFGLLLGLPVALAWNPIAGAVVFAAQASHVLADQLGFMGSNLWYPFTRRRTRGFKRLRSTDPFANTAMVWICLLLIVWNLSRAAGPETAYTLPRLLLYGALLPLGVARLAERTLRAAATKE